MLVHEVPPSMTPRGHGIVGDVREMLMRSIVSWLGFLKEQTLLQGSECLCGVSPIEGREERRGPKDLSSITWEPLHSALLGTWMAVQNSPWHCIPWGPAALSG
jgi:hypothetical protein